ncbi:DUF1488 domain-containing protein [Parashewanella tropica]|uniref:DUF1488 domain-containing protein n=1 Tax=Parashewanella tropica TaxID=2547970 RepID=UPI00105A1C36|nr:DUF1488 domain-containing protein [Parashewanella tropica]
MNQSIIFIDDIEWSEQDQAVVLTAQLQGMMIPCKISLAKLNEIFSSDITNKSEALELAEHKRFDLEDMFEELIEQEAMNEQGIVVYS